MLKYKENGYLYYCRNYDKYVSMHFLDPIPILDYLYHMVALPQFDDGMQQPISQHLPSTHLGVIIDLINCWNNMSQDAALEPRTTRRY
jgi:hypothetical protein